MSPSPAERRLLAGAGFVVVATFAVGLGVRAFGHTMGTGASPLVSPWLPRVDPAALVAIPVAIAAALLAPRLLALPERVYLGAVAALAAVLALALNAIPLGPHGWDVVFDDSFEAKNEYLPTVTRGLHFGSAFFLDHFAELVPSLPINVGGHPPGIILLLSGLHADTPARMAALCLLCVAVIAPLTYALARTLGSDRARVAGLLAACSPGMALFGLSSADGILAALGLAATVLLIHRRLRIAGVVVFALATFTAWSLMAIGFFAAVVVWRREGWRPALTLAVGCGVAVLALNGALAAAYGYDPVGTLKATHIYYGKSLARIRPYAFWWIGSPVAWAVSMGLPIAAGWLLATRRRDAGAVALAAVVVIAAVAGFTKAETERIWLPFVPLACAAAATAIPPARLRAVLCVLVAQGVAVSLLLQTIW